MFTESVRVGCDFPACCGGSAKYQICLIFHQPYLTLVPTMAPSTWKQSCLVSLHLVIVSSRAVLYCYRLVVKHLIMIGHSQNGFQVNRATVGINSKGASVKY